MPEPIEIGVVFTVDPTFSDPEKVRKAFTQYLNVMLEIPQESDEAAPYLITGLRYAAKPEIVIIEHPENDPTWAVLGDPDAVDIKTMSSYPWSKFGSEEEVVAATETYLEMLREKRGSEAFREWLQPWLVEELATRDRDFHVDWQRLVIVEATTAEGLIPLLAEAGIEASSPAHGALFIDVDATRQITTGYAGWWYGGLTVLVDGIWDEDTSGTELEDFCAEEDEQDLAKVAAGIIREVQRLRGQ